MISRSSTVYYELPMELAGANAKKKKDAKATIAMSVVVPADMEKKAAKFMDSMAEEYADRFKKFMKKEVKKRMTTEG